MCDNLRILRQKFLACFFRAFTKNLRYTPRRSGTAYLHEATGVCGEQPRRQADHQKGQLSYGVFNRSID